MWVFGLCDTSGTPALGYIEDASSRDATTLLPIIQVYVQLGIYNQSYTDSDEWRAYDNTTSLPSVAGHSTVTHSLLFVEPTTGTHTQKIEGYWARVKCKCKRMKGCQATELTSYLMSFFGVTGSVRLPSLNICSDISIFYSV